MAKWFLTLVVKPRVVGFELVVSRSEITKGDVVGLERFVIRQVKVTV